jgi:hypothetical protein
VGAERVLLSFFFEQDWGPPLVEPALEAYEHGEECDVIVDLARVVCGRRDAWLLRWRTHSVLMNGA